MVVKAEECTNKVVFALKKSAGPSERSHPSQTSLLSIAAILDKQHPVSFRQIVERMVMNRHNNLSD